MHRVFVFVEAEGDLLLVFLRFTNLESLLLLLRACILAAGLRCDMFQAVDDTATSRSVSITIGMYEICMKIVCNKFMNLMFYVMVPPSFWFLVKKLKGKKAKPLFI